MGVDAEVRIDNEFDELEVVDGEVVDPVVKDLTITDAGDLRRSDEAALTRTPNPKLQTAAAAATGFVAGAATLALLRRYGAAKLARAAEQQPPARPLPPERGMTYLVHVRPLGRPQ